MRVRNFFLIGAFFMVGIFTLLVAGAEKVSADMSQTVAPDSTSIAVYNYVYGLDDKVVVNSLSVGDTVYVYDAASGGTLLGHSISGGTSTTVNIPQLGTSSGTVYVSKLTGGYPESERTGVPYTAETIPWIIYDHTANQGEDFKHSNFTTGQSDSRYTGSTLSSHTPATYPAYPVYDSIYDDSSVLVNGSNTTEFNKHIIIKENGERITFYGYGVSPYKDFMFLPSDDASTKTVTFDFNLSTVSFHTLEGAGFLFNTEIKNDGKLYGYAVLFTGAVNDKNNIEDKSQRAVKLFQLNGVSVSRLNDWSSKNDGLASITPEVTLLHTSSVKGTAIKNYHNIELIISPKNFTMKDYNNTDTYSNSKAAYLTLMDYTLPMTNGNPTIQGHGVGFISSYLSHQCSVLSYLTFNNVVIAGSTWPIVDLSAAFDSTNKQAVLTYTLPTGADVVAIQYSLDKNFTNPTTVTISDPNNRTITTSGIGPYYFRLLVGGGVNAGISNVASSTAASLNYYTITFDKNTGDTDPSPSTESVASGGFVNPLPEEPTKNGYRFSGWKDGNDNDFTNETPVSVSKTVYAQWTINQYTISFEENGGTTVADMTYNYGTGITAPTAPTKTGYSFGGWKTTSELTSGYTFPPTMPAVNTTVYAKWDINQYTIRFEENGGSQITDITRDYSTIVAEPSQTPIRGGYSFGGWYTAPDLRTPYVFTTMPAQNITLYAMWYEDILVPYVPVDKDSDIFLKRPDGKPVLFQDYTPIKVVPPEGSAPDQPVAEVDKNGNVTVTNTKPGYTYELDIVYTLKPGVQLVIGKLSVVVDDKGNATVNKTLIDPYGKITDIITDEILPGSKAVLYFADTQRNKDQGFVPGTAVEIPIIKGFAPNDNANPQLADEFGDYAYMVYPHSDYYIIVEKDGYITHKTKIISVEKEIVNYDIQLTPKEIRDLSVRLYSDLSKVEEERQITYEVRYFNKSKYPSEDVVVTIDIPDGFTVVDAAGGTLVGNKLTFNKGSLPAYAKGSWFVVVKAPKLDKASYTPESKANIKASNKLYYLEDDTSSLKVLAYSNRFPHLDKRYVKGYPDNTFRPGRGITRAEVAGVFARILDLKSTVTGIKAFPDVPLTHWAAQYVEAMKTKGYMTGNPDGTFNPDQPITREDFALTMARIMGLTTSIKGVQAETHFSDVGSSYASYAIEELYRNKIVSGYEDGLFHPKASITRAEAVTMINRMLFRGKLTNVTATFPDMTEGNWAFGNAEESIRTHTYTINPDGTEVMKEYIEEPLW